MRLSARQRAILAALEGREYVEVKDLASRLDVDSSTIRRDLQGLVRDDLVERLHGGVRRRGADAPATEPVGPDGECQAIAASARRMIRDGDRIALGAGPCTDHLVRALMDAQDLTVITTDLRAAGLFARHPHTRVVVAGGELRDAPGSAVLSGPATAAFLEAQQADWSFLEVEGVHPFAGLTTGHPGHVSAMRGLLSAGDRRVALARSGAFGARCVGFIAEVSEVDLVITDEHLDDRDLPAFSGRVVRGAVEPVDDWRVTPPLWWAAPGAAH